MHISAVDVEFDPEKASANRRKHGVAFSDAEQVLYDPLGIVIEDPDAADEHRYVCLGADAPRTSGTPIYPR